MTPEGEVDIEDNMAQGAEEDEFESEDELREGQRAAQYDAVCKGLNSTVENDVNLALCHANKTSDDIVAYDADDESEDMGIVMPHVPRFFTPLMGAQIEKETPARPSCRRTNPQVSTHTTQHNAHNNTQTHTNTHNNHTRTHKHTHTQIHIHRQQPT